MTDQFFRRTMILAAAVAIASAVPAIAQYRIDNGSARDANNRIGSGGFNDRSSTTPGGLNGNLIVTGNVANGRSFRGALGYTDQYSFRGDVGSASFDRFNRDSVGINQLRGAPNSVYANQGVTTYRPYFGGGQTVAPPPGYVQDAATGGFVLQRPAIVQPSDGRLDYGGASRAQVTGGMLSQQSVIGGAGVAAGGNLPDQRAALSQPFNASEYTTLARPAARIGLLEQADRNSPPNGVFSDPRDPNAPGNAGPLETARQADDAAAQRTGAQAVPEIGDANRLSPQDALNQSGQPTPSGVTPTGTTPSGPNSTGQRSSRRDLRVEQNNAQYAALRDRLKQQGQNSSGISTSGVDAIQQSNERNQAVLTQRQQQGRESDDATAKTGSPTIPAAGGSLPLPGNAPTAATPANGATAKAPTPAAGNTAERAAQTPVEIQSFASGIRDPQLRQALSQADTLMKEGKFTSAIDAFARADAIAKDDPLVFVGRGVAELGGGYYRPAERHLREAFAGDQSLLFARFDLREMLTADRLNFVIDDLGRVANANKNDPGPLLLLAFVYYNANVPDRAARALELAQERAGGKDATIKLLQANWSLSTNRPAGDDNK